MAALRQVNNLGFQFSIMRTKSDTITRCFQSFLCRLLAVSLDRFRIQLGALSAARPAPSQSAWRLTAAHMGQLYDRWLLIPRLAHPYPSARFDAIDRKSVV